MVISSATSVDQYVAELPPERRDTIARVYDLVRANMPAGYKLGMDWGMICWTIPLSRYPGTYNGQPLCYVSIAAQKHHYAIYMMGLYMDPAATAEFARAFAAAGKRLDMGKSCVRFKSLDDLALDAVADAVARITPEQYIARYEETRAATKSGARQRGKAKPATKKTAAKKATRARQAKAGAMPATKRSSAKTTATKPAAKKRATARAGTRARRA